MNKFNVGDFVKFADGITAKDMGIIFTPVDLKKVYRIAMKDGKESYKLDDESLSCFSFHSDWLSPAKLEFREKGLGIKRVIFNKPATIVFWTDGTKTVVKCRKGDKWDAEKGLAMACAKKLLGNEDGYHKEIAKYTKTAKKDESVLMDTEKLRSLVSKTCNSLTGCTDCPCRISNGGKCFIIASANGEQLSTMYRQFLYAGKLWKEERNA